MGAGCRGWEKLLVRDGHRQPAVDAEGVGVDAGWQRVREGDGEIGAAVTCGGR